MRAIKGMIREDEGSHTPIRTESETVTKSSTMGQSLTQSETVTPTSSGSLSQVCTSGQSSASPKDTAEACANDVECSQAFASRAQANPNGAAGQAILEELKNQCGPLGQKLIENNEEIFLSQQCNAAEPEPIESCAEDKMPSTLVMAKMSNYTYYFGAPDTPWKLTDGWKLVANSDNDYKNENYMYDSLALAFSNAQETAITIAFRGTSNLMNMNTDIELSVSFVPQPFCVLSNFITEVMKKYKDSCLTFTGHSLGAAEGEFYSMRHEVKARVFDTPGMKALAEKNKGNSFCSFGASFTLEEKLINKAKDNIITYNAAPNFVDTMAHSLGKVVSTYIPPAPEVLLPNFHLDYNFVPQILGAFYILDSAYQHRSIMFNEVYSSTNFLYNPSGKLRVSIDHGEQWPAGDGSAGSCLTSVMNTTLYEQVLLIAWCSLATECPSLTSAIGENQMGSLLQEFGCSAGFKYFKSYNYNTQYWQTSFIAKNKAWRYDENIQRFIRNNLTKDTGSGFIINGDDNGNYLPGTNRNDIITAGKGNDKHVLFCGDDSSTDTGGANQYLFLDNICGKKVIDEQESADTQSSRIIVGANVMMNNNTEVKVDGGLTLGTAFKISESTCSACSIDDTYIFNTFDNVERNKNDGTFPTVPLLTIKKEGNPLEIFSDCFSTNHKESVNSIVTTKDFSDSDFGINFQEDNSFKAMIGYNPDCSPYQQCIAAAVCNNPEGGGISITTSTTNKQSILFGSSKLGSINFKIIKMGESNTVTGTATDVDESDTVTETATYTSTTTVTEANLIRIIGIKIDDKITARVHQAQIQQDGVTANFEIDNTQIYTQTATDDVAFVCLCVTSDGTIKVVGWDGNGADCTAVVC